MQLVFSTDAHARAKRYDAWRSAICDHYVNVDVKATRPENYKGYIREAAFGEVVLTDILLSEQTIKRNAGHISKLDKDCYYLQFLHRGNLNVLQRGSAHSTNAARGAIFCATEEYELQCGDNVRAFYLEVPRDDFAQRFAKEQIPVSGEFDCTQGLGRISTEFCAMLVAEGPKLDTTARANLGNQLMDILAITLQSASGDMAIREGAVRQARLRSVKLWIEKHIDDAELSLDRIAQANGMSLRNLHQLFHDEEKSVSEWIWDRRLQLCYSAITASDGSLITTIALEHGFSNLSHFSTAFRRKFGMSPRDLQKARGRADS